MNTVTDQDRTAVTDLYERDFYAWLMHNAALIRQGRLAEIDAGNVAEELESMGRSERRELIHRLEILLMHLLKWRYQPERRGRSWRNTIRIQRIDTRRLLADNSSLRAQSPTLVAEAYEKACLLAAGETELPEDRFPSACPFTLQQALDDGFWPDG